MSKDGTDIETFGVGIGVGLFLFDPDGCGLGYSEVKHG
jgi:hypothetical protein